MRIFPNTARIGVTQSVNMETDIPLAYVDADSITHDIDIATMSEFSVEDKSEIIPYQRFPNNKVTFFNNDGEQIPYEEVRESLIRDGKDFIYMPKKSRRFTPKTFNYNIIAKRKSKYIASMPYNIKALAYSCKSYANNLISIFADANVNGNAPSNVTVNHGDFAINSLINESIKNVDVTFLRMKTNEIIIEDADMESGKTIETAFNKDMFLDDFRANMIGFFDTSLISDGTEGIDENKVMLYKRENKEYKIEEGIFCNGVTIETDKAFNIPKQKDGIIYHNLFGKDNFAPILIEEHIEKGFFIYMSEDIINSIKKYSKIVYEFIGYIYFNRYLKSNTFSEWIADKVPDYCANSMKLTRKLKFLSEHKLENIFAIDGEDLTVVKVDIDNKLYPFVEYIGMENDYLEFKKIDDEKWRDPIKKDHGEIAIYSYPDIFFYKDFIYSINDSFKDKIKAIKNGNRIEVFYDEFKHSRSSIFLKKGSNPLVIELTRKTRSNEEEHTLNADYKIICQQNDGISSLYIIEKDMPHESNHVVLATLTLRQKSKKTTIIDMRQRGGGLSIHSKDNFECLDIGHVYGRPHRNGGAIIITLPKKLKQHENRIKAVIMEHCAAGEYPILLFEGDK